MLKVCSIKTFAHHSFLNSMLSLWQNKYASCPCLTSPPDRSEISFVGPSTSRHQLRLPPTWLCTKVKSWGPGARLIGIGT